MEPADIDHWRRQPIPLDSSEKRQYLYAAFLNVIDVVEQLIAFGGEANLNIEQRSTVTNWARYRNEPDAPRRIQVCFVEYLEDTRWTMRGTNRSSPERNESVAQLRRISMDALSHAMAIYEARRPRFASPPAEHIPQFPSPSQYSTPFENATSSGQGGRSSSAGSYGSEGPPGPPPSSATKSQFSMNSEMMFPMDT